jgi:hypothetical protein
MARNAKKKTKAWGLPFRREPWATLKARFTDRVWTVVEYVCYPVHVGELQRAIWAEHRENLLTNSLNRQKRPKPLPTS